MNTRPERQQNSSREEKWTRLLRTLIVLLILVIAFILLWIFFPRNFGTNKFQEIPINFHSVAEGNYNADPTQYWNPAANLSILKDIIIELEPESENLEERIDNVLVTLSAPVPTAQPQPTGPGITRTNIPGNPTPTPTRRPTSTSIGVTSSITSTSYLTSSPTLTVITQTSTGTIAPTLTATPQVTDFATTTPTKTQTPGNSQTSTFTAAPTFTPTRTFTPTYTKSPAPTQIPTDEATATSTSPNPTKTKKHTPKSTQGSITTPTFTANVINVPASVHDDSRNIPRESLRSIALYLFKQMVMLLSQAHPIE